MKLFEPFTYKNLNFENRIIRSATFEGMADADGFPSSSYHKLYSNLSRQGIGAIITGFAYINENGKAMQPGQAGIDSDEKIPVYQKITEAVHKNNGKIYLQIAHAGRQTIRDATGGELWGVSAKKSYYFNEKPDVLSTLQIYELIDDFSKASFRAKKAGFDGIQLHAAHGYLIHQFILPSINNRNDEFGIDNKFKLGIRFLDLVIQGIKRKCSDGFPILVKISGSDDYFNKFRKKHFINLIRFLDETAVDVIEISYGTMDYALNIFRGGSLPLSKILMHNPRYKTNSNFIRLLWKYIFSLLFSIKLKKIKPVYNLYFAQLAKKYTNISIISVGGFRSGLQMEESLKNKKTDLIALSRPFICEPDFTVKLKNSISYVSKCKNCNICAIMCDTKNITRCYQQNNLEIK